MSALKQFLKTLLFRLLGKDPEGAVVSVLSGDAALGLSMAEEFRRLVPDRRHFVVGFEAPEGIGGAIVIRLDPGSTWQLYRELRRKFRALRVAQAAVLFTGDRAHRPLRRAAFLLAPCKILAYNAKLERHHLRLGTLIASLLFLRRVALDRIFLRPWWLCPWKKERSVVPATHRILEGRPLSAARRRVAVLSPYFPYPLSHGGAVRVFHLLREASRGFDIFLFAFQEDEREAEYAPVLEFCARVILVAKPRYREPRWSSLLPPEVCEYRSPMMLRLLRDVCRDYSIGLVQVEYTQLASYQGDVLVEHDVTFDLYRQIFERQRSLSAWWNHARWQRFERKAIERYRAAVAMSEKDAEMLAGAHVRVIGNGVDLGRFRPEPETDGQRLLFIGAFRHFPNIVAFRFFMDEVWPALRDRFPEMTLTVVAGPDPQLYWRAAQDTPAPPAGPRIRMLEFVRDVRPLYVEANLVVVPTLVSAGTNVKVLEAMAMERAVVSTTSGCAGLGLEHGSSVWMAGSPSDFVEGVSRLINDSALRRRIAGAARRIAEERFGWKRLGSAQRALWDELLPRRVAVRPGRPEDLEEVSRIQAASPESASWDPRDYVSYDFLVAEWEGKPAGFLVCRAVCEGEREILNLAVAPGKRRNGVATALLRHALDAQGGSFYLEVRESNHAARHLYRKLGFEEAGLRPRYYQNPDEDGIVMRLQSC